MYGTALGSYQTLGLGINCGAKLLESFTRGLVAVSVLFLMAKRIRGFFRHTSRLSLIHETFLPDEG